MLLPSMLLACLVAAPDVPRHRPVVMGTHGMVASGNPLVSNVALDVLKRGGNAADAGVAALFAAMVVEHTHHSLGGESSILYYDARQRRVHAVNAVGPAPRLATRELFQKLGGIPDEDSFLIAPVPGTLDGAVTTLDRFGTRRLSDVLQPAIDLAAKGHPVDHLVARWIDDSKAILAHWPGSARAFLPGGRPPRPGELWVQPEYAETLRRILRGEQQNLGKGRSGALQAARDVFYRGELARALDAFSRENGGLLRYDDLASYHARVEAPLETSYAGYQVYSVGTWSQGPMLLQVLNLLEGFDVAGLKPNGPEYIHLVVEAFKLAYADRHAFFADPYVVQVPQAGLVSKAYAAERRRLIDLARAATEVAPGEPWRFQAPGAAAPAGGGSSPPAIGRGERFQMDTTAIVVVDEAGNMFATTSSNNMGVRRSGVTPTGLGFVLSGRLRQFSLDPANPNVMAGGKIPCVTPAPSLALKDGAPAMVWTTPGEDVQMQANLQVFLDVVHFGMDPQSAVEAPRFRTLHGPAAAYPQELLPAQLRVEPRIAPEVVSALAALGHQVKAEADWAEASGGMVMITRDPRSGVLSAGADPRRSCYAVGW